MEKNRYEQLIDMIQVAIEVDTIGLHKAARAEQVIVLSMRIAKDLREWSQEYYKEVIEDGRD